MTAKFALKSVLIGFACEYKALAFSFLRPKCLTYLSNVVLFS